MKKINFTDTPISLFQDNVASALTPIENSTLVGGLLLSNISLTSAQDNLISHQLGYSPTMILPLTPNVSSNIWSPTTASLNNSNVSPSQFNLRCSTTCVVSVWIK